MTRIYEARVLNTNGTWGRVQIIATSQRLAQCWLYQQPGVTKVEMGA